jgi:tetratricopeptide (TPR) repeat protein
MIDPITPLFLRALPSLAKHYGQLALKEVFPPVSKAIKATATDFPQYPELRRWLDGWCASPQFFVWQGLYRNGEIPSVSAVTESFEQFIGLVNPDHQRRCAEEVLPVFLLHIDEEELGSVGIAMADHRNQARHEELRTQLQQITSIVTTSQQSLLAGAQVPENDRFARSPEEAAFDVQLDTAKRLIDAWHPRSARLILEDLRPKLGNNRISTGLRFRLEALTGCVCLAAGDAKRAEGHFRLAVELDPENARARANLSTARARTGLTSEALEDASWALTLAPQDAYVASIHVRRLVESERYSEFEEFLGTQTEKLADPHFLGAVGDGYWSQGRRQDIETIIRPRLKSEVQFAPAWEVVGRSLLVEAQTIMQTQSILPWQMPAHLSQMIQNAEGALSETITLIGRTEGDSGLAGVYVNRASSRSLLGKLADAEDDIDHALALKRDLDEANHAKAMLLIHRREYRPALEYLRRIDPSDLTLEMRGAAGFAYFRSDQPREAVRELTVLFKSPEASLHQKVLAAELLVQVHHQMGDPQSSEDVVAALKGAAPDDPEVLCVESQHKECSGDTEGAKRAVERAFEIADTQKRTFVAIDLASFYFRGRLYSDAARVYEGLSGPHMNPGLRQKYVESLARSGQIGKTYDFIRKVRLEEGFDTDLADLEFQICEQIGDLDEAGSILEELKRRVPAQRARYNIRLATNHYRRSNKEACGKVLSAVVKSELAGSADELMQAAKLRRWLGMEDALDFGYAAWLAGRDRPEIALRYLSLTLVPQKSDHVLFQSSPADLGSRVILRRGGESRTIDLVGDDQPETPPARVRVTSPLGKKLLHVMKGAEVVIGGESYLVEEVQSKYIAAHQDILRDFQLAFPDHPGLRRMEFKDGDLTPLFAMIERRYEYADGALRVYHEKRIPLGTLASLLGEPLLDVWLSLVKTESSDRVLASAGNELELQLEANTLSEATDAVLDSTALLTVVRLNRLHLLRQRFGTVYVAQEVLDEFLDAAAVVEFGPHSGGRIGRVGSRYVMTEKLDEGHQRERAAILRELIPYLTTEAVLVPCRGRLRYSPDEWAGFERTLGRGAIASVLVASDLALPLYSDDFAIAAVARNDWKVKSFWTQSLLLDSLRRSLLSQSEYFDLVSSLIHSHYHFVRIDARYLLRIFEKSGLALSKEVLEGLGILGDLDCSIESAITVAAEVVATCFGNPLPTHFQEMVLDATLGALILNRSADIVLPALSKIVGQRLGTGCRADLKVQATIHLWQRILFR